MFFITYLQVTLNGSLYILIYFMTLKFSLTLLGRSCGVLLSVSIHWRRKRGGGGGGVRRGQRGGGGMCPPVFWWGGGDNGMFVPPLLTPHFYFPLELYVYIPLTNNDLAFFIYQIIIVWTISINWHRWLLVNNHISKYNSFILVLYRSYINYVSVCPPHTLFGTFLRHCYIN